MTDDEVRRDRDVISQATPEPWEVASDLDLGGGRGVMLADRVPHLPAIRVSCVSIASTQGSRTESTEQRDADAAFIAAARTRWPLCVVEVGRMRAEIKVLWEAKGLLSTALDAYESGDDMQRILSREWAKAAEDVLGWLDLLRYGKGTPL